MAKFTVLYTLHEVQVDENDDFIRAYENNLPHGKELAKALCDDWNKADYMLDIVNRDCYDRIESCNMKEYRTNDGTTSLAIEFVAKPGRQLTRKVKDAIEDFAGAQFSDGWGEGVFGLINVIESKDGTRFYAE